MTPKFLDKSDIQVERVSKKLMALPVECRLSLVREVYNQILEALSSERASSYINSIKTVEKWFNSSCRLVEQGLFVEAIVAMALHFDIEEVESLIQPLYQYRKDEAVAKYNKGDLEAMNRFYRGE